ncbi:hypothetical protein, partial [Chelatococcus sp.]
REATPRPWIVVEDTFDEVLEITTLKLIEDTRLAIVSRELGFRADIDAESRANAALIVEAVNHFDEVVGVLRELLDSLTARFPEAHNNPLVSRGYFLLSKLEASHDN